MTDRSFSQSEHDSAARIGFRAARSEFYNNGYPDDQDTFRDNVHPGAFAEALDRFDEVGAVDISDAVDQGIRDFLASPEFLNTYNN